MAPLREPAAVSLLKEVDHVLADPRLGVSVFTIRRYRDALQKELRDAPAGIIGPIFGTLGTCNARLDELPAALSAFRNAARHQPQAATHECNIALTLTMMGQHREALEHTAKARTKSDLRHIDRIILDANEAEMHFKLGDKTKARAAFERAAKLADPQNPEAENDDNLRLARHATELGYEHDATEFLARYLLGAASEPRGDEAAPEVIQARSQQAGEVMRHLPDLAAAVARVLAEWDGPVPDEHAIRSHVALDAEAWAKICELADLPPHT